MMKTNMGSALQKEIACKGYLILDGPTGTELLARGYPPHPVLWTALAAQDAPALLVSIHRDYVEAGADILTANTFRTTSYALGQARRAAEAERLTRKSVALAAAGSEYAGRRALIAGSLAPLEDCYHPERVPDQAVLERAHRQAAALLGDAGCDLVLVETMGTACEALCAVRAVRAETGLPVLVSFLPAQNGQRLLGGDLLLPAARECLAAGAEAILVNCVHTDVIDTALRCLAPLGGEVLLGAYANAARMHLRNGEPMWEPDPRPVSEQAREYGQRAATWIREGGVGIVGSCCGTGPEHIRRLALALG